MRKIGVLIGLFILTSTIAVAQKYAFVDSEYIRKNIPKFTTAQEQLDKLPANLRAHAKLIQGGFYFSATTAAHPPTAPTPAVTPAAGPEAAPSPSPTASPAGSAIVGTPQIGDLRVTFSIVPPGDVSLIAQQAGNSFVPYAADAGEKIEMLTPGVKSAAEMYAQAQAENRFWTWILRLAGFLAMAIGLALTASPIRTVANILPFIGDVVGGIAGFVAFAVALPLSLITISIAWVYYRPIVGVPILIVGLAGIVGAFVLKAKKAKPKTV